MKSLFLDTAWKNLVIVLMEDGQIRASFSKEAFKKQSETLMAKLQEMLGEAGWKLKDIDEVMITDGPGSYTGLRIAMTSAKLLASQLNIPLKTISTFQLYAGKEDKANVILDARGHRAYAAHLENGKEISAGIVDLDVLEQFLASHPGTLFGEGELVHQPAASSDFAANAASLLEQGQVVDNVMLLTPRYMKENDSYLV